jgi:NADH-quinone oxidoreductase subunit G
LIDTLPEQQLADLAAEIDAGNVKTLFVVNEDLTAAGLSVEQLSKVSIIYAGSHNDATAQKAAVVLAGLSVFEKSGSFINQQFRLQKFVPAVPGPEGVVDDLVILGTLLANLSGVEAPSTANSVWQMLATAVPALAGISFAKIPATGVVVEGAAFAGLPFVEKKALHFDPAASVEAAVAN